MRFFGMPFVVKPSAGAGSLILLVIAVAVGMGLGGASFIGALIGGLVIVAGHWLLVLVHHYGHFMAARSAGFPMHHAALWGLIGTDIYYEDDKDISAAVHIKRALGGPIKSLQLAVILTLLALAATPTSFLWIPAFLWADNLAMFVIGAFIPGDILGIETDGSTLLKWWGQR